MKPINPQSRMQQCNILPLLFLLICALFLTLPEVARAGPSPEPAAVPAPALFRPEYKGAGPSNIALGLSRQAKKQLSADETRAHETAHREKPVGFEDLELLDIVIISTVDGALHALERSTGRKIWSRPGIVGEERGVIKSRYNTSSGEPWYIVDPHDGQLYAYYRTNDGKAHEDGTLQRLPLNLEELINRSPFSFPQEKSLIFIGSKATSLMGIDLQSGQPIGSFGTLKSSGVGYCKPDEKGDGLYAEEEECESDIDERPEDLLFFGQTDYHLVMRSQTGHIIQDLHHSKIVPNSIHRDLADYWSKNGHIKGEVTVRPGRKYSGYTGSFNSAASNEQVEYEDRLRVEMRHDGIVVGMLQEKGPQWSYNLRSMGVSAFDVLLPGTPGSQPILVPQPPVHLPTLYANEEINLQLMSLPASTFIHQLARVPDEAIEEELDAMNFYAMSSNNHPFIGYVPLAETGSLVGRHLVTEAIQERLPPLLDPADDVETHGADELSQSETDRRSSSNGTQIIELIERTWWYDQSGWLLAGLTGLVAILLVLAVYWYNTRLDLMYIPPRSVVDSKPSIVSETPAVDKALPDLPVEVEAAPMNGHPLEEKPDHANGKKPNGRRRKRGKKNRNKRDSDDEENELTETEALAADNGSGSGEMKVRTPPVESQPENLVEKIVKDHQVTQVDGLSVTDDVIGFGSHGTVVYKGVFQGRAVAVKRLLRDFVSIASQEVALLQASDDHQNVIRYFYQEKRDNFLFIALELCPASLADIIESPQAHQELVVGFDRKKAIYQITSGLKHLHGLKIIHRDLKPQNVLVSVNKKGIQRMLLSDFGLAKRLDHGQSSYAQTANHAVGSIGWRAPECLRGEVRLDDLFENSSQTSFGNGTSHSSSSDGLVTLGKHARLTKAVDLFSLGCMYFYVMTGGMHPFGDRYEREMNIVRGNIIGLDRLDAYGEEGYEAKCLIGRLLSPVSSERPDTAFCMTHPMFWSAARRLAFLCDASDRFEIMELQPPEPTLTSLESKALQVIGQSWQKRLDSVFLENLGKHRKYDSRSLRDLLRALRNKKHHYQDLPDNVKRRLGPLPIGFLSYFTTRFPMLFTHVHSVVQDSKLRHESMFVPYFDLEE